MSFVSTYVCVCVCVCVCVGGWVGGLVCVRACVGVCWYSSTVDTSSICKMSETYLRSTDQRYYVVSTIPGVSAKFPHLYF